ncbi:MAG TPA: class I SAM-dependent methyltransferase [Pyrinomonadaceae bacterium]|nr:class I SAM-dependent methyltransferase [Pyrinomonadaceae bacterium]
MSNVKEINLGYVDHLRRLNQGAKGASSPDDNSAPRSLRLRFGLWRYAVLNNMLLPAFTAVGVVTLGLTLAIWLRVYLLIKRDKTSELTHSALDSVDEFLTQYPFHLYPIVCKAFELACLGRQIPELLKQQTRCVEIAIGEGTLSSRVFPKDATVVGLDLSPYSLKKASEKAHVKRAVVCDCLAPPVREGSFDVLIANNFLHHVTRKEETLARWSRIAAKAVFNENSPTWASGWPRPYVLRKLGRKGKAEQAADAIEKMSLQSLEPKQRLDEYVSKSYEVDECVSYMSERTFFYCGLFSWMMRCYGPPTPAKMKNLFLTKLRWLALPLSADLAKLLIRYDQHQDRSTDSFISYLCTSKNYVAAPAGSYLACADCQQQLNETNRCAGCGKEYSYTDGMLFLLPEALKDLQQGYNYELSLQTPKEHL